MKSIGFDFGSAYTKAALIENGEVTDFTFYRKKSSDQLKVINQFLAQIDEKYPGQSFMIGITGLPSSNSAFQELTFCNAIMATAECADFLGFSGSSVIEIGGQNAKLIEVDPDNPGNIIDFTMNDACAAGSGLSLEQHATRLELSLGDFSKISSNVEKKVAIAGRCAVFAKTDMIHLQQKGVQVNELAYGLCLAMSRNFQALLLKGRDLKLPVMLSGGCAKNAGVVRAFKATLGLNDESVFVSPFPGMEGAIGAACLATKQAKNAKTLKAVKKQLKEILQSLDKEPEFLAPLVRIDKKNEILEPEEKFSQQKVGYLGVDVGSVSTDLVVIDQEGKLISSVYLPTRGQPLQVLKNGLSILKKRFNKGLKVVGCGTTGSGRHLAGKILGADIIKNEITCQFLGVQHYYPEVDTIFEIGGQDSKFISIKNGGISDFVMNKVCAAGTGSFLEEQASDMGMSIYKEFADEAFSAKKPVDLGSHCTVFMETEVVNAVHHGIPSSDICAGLSYSIARNYLEKVVGNKKIGNKVAFQGGVASNLAVVSAFEQLLDQPVTVIPFNRISGAIGAAIAAKNHMLSAESKFRGLDCSVDAKLSTFQCHGCSNNCEVKLIEQAGEKIYYGDICERYTAGGGKSSAECNIPELAKEYVATAEQYFTRSDENTIKIGIPRASTMLGYLPFWGTFFRELGCSTYLSDATSSETVFSGMKNLPASVCLPVKLTAGHVTSLLKKNLDFVFVPSIMHLPGEKIEQSYACPYAMAMPFMINSGKSKKILSPVLSMFSGRDFVEGMDSCLEPLGVTRAKVKEAYRKAIQAQSEFQDKMRKRAAALIAGGEYSYVFAIIGKPYNVLDPYLNLGLFERLRRKGILGIPIEILPVQNEKIECELPWGFSADVFHAAVAAVKSENIYPLLISNYGCALDAFTYKQLGRFLSQKPHLFLEFDEHRGEVGMITRIEAFLDQLESVERPRYEVLEPGSELPPVALVPELDELIKMPFWSDYVYASAGLWEHKGYKVEILPMPDQEVRILGEKHSLGKECSPYAMIVGDLVKLHQKNPEKKQVFHFPNLAFPCLLNQYGNGIQALIRDMNISNLRLSCLNGSELTHAFGLQAMQLLYEGLLAIDVLVKGACETRPYELEQGMTSEIHRENLQLIRKGIANGDVITALDKALEKIAKIPVDRNKKRPLVGIAGDLYTKINETANSNLFLWLEDQGLEVWPSPSQVDLLNCGISSSFRNSLARMEFGNIIGSGLVALKAMYAAWRVRNTVGDRVKRLQEPEYLDLLKLAEPYMNNRQYELLLLNIAKIVDFIERGAGGIINATCFNCMVGNASAAIIEKIRRDYVGTPIITAVYAGSQDPAREMQLDAFACQVKEKFKT
jgi:predicted CoA-substrate-specific enzyme activase